MSDPLTHYAELVRRYHKTLDLISEGAIHQLESKILESIRWGSFILSDDSADDKGENSKQVRLLDIGAGVGLPAIPLAISNPNWHLTLVERRRRRASFLRLVVSQLGLSNVAVVEADVRDHHPAERFAVVTAQAVGRLALMYDLSTHLHTEWVTLVARRGEGYADELEELKQQLELAELVTRETPLEEHGRLVAVSLAGGLHCPSSASSTKRAE